MILDISTLCSNDTLRIIYPRDKRIEYATIRRDEDKRKKENKIGRKRGERKMDK